MKAAATIAIESNLGIDLCYLLNNGEPEKAGVRLLESYFDSVKLNSLISEGAINFLRHNVDCGARKVRSTEEPNYYFETYGISEFLKRDGLGCKKSLENVHFNSIAGYAMAFAQNRLAEYNYIYTKDGFWRISFVKTIDEYATIGHYMYPLQDYINKYLGVL